MWDLVTALGGSSRASLAWERDPQEQVLLATPWGQAAARPPRAVAPGVQFWWLAARRSVSQAAGVRSQGVVEAQHPCARNLPFSEEELLHHATWCG